MIQDIAPKIYKNEYSRSFLGPAIICSFMRAGKSW